MSAIRTHDFHQDERGGVVGKPNKQKAEDDVEDEAEKKVDKPKKGKPDTQDEDDEDTPGKGKADSKDEAENDADEPKKGRTDDQDEGKNDAKAKSKAKYDADDNDTNSTSWFGWMSTEPQNATSSNSTAENNLQRFMIPCVVCVVLLLGGCFCCLANPKADANTEEYFGSTCKVDEPEPSNDRPPLNAENAYAFLEAANREYVTLEAGALKKWMDEANLDEGDRIDLNRYEDDIRESANPRDEIAKLKVAWNVYSSNF